MSNNNNNNIIAFSKAPTSVPVCHKNLKLRNWFSKVKVFLKSPIRTISGKPYKEFLIRQRAQRQYELNQLIMENQYTAAVRQRFRRLAFVPPSVPFEDPLFNKRQMAARKSELAILPSLRKPLALTALLMDMPRRQEIEKELVELVELKSVSSRIKEYLSSRKAIEKELSELAQLRLVSSHKDKCRPCSKEVDLAPCITKSKPRKEQIGNELKELEPLKLQLTSKMWTLYMQQKKRESCEELKGLGLMKLVTSGQLKSTIRAMYVRCPEDGQEQPPKSNLLQSCSLEAIGITRTPSQLLL